MVDNHWIEFKPEDYILDMSDRHDGSVCILAFIANSGDYWLVGDNFFRGYYAVHDDANNRIGLVPHAFSEKLPLEYVESKPLQLIKSWTWYWQIIDGVFGGAFFLGLYQYIWPYVKKWWNKNHEDDENEDDDDGDIKVDRHSKRKTPLI